MMRSRSDHLNATVVRDDAYQRGCRLAFVCPIKISVAENKRLTSLLLVDSAEKS